MQIVQILYAISNPDFMVATILDPRCKLGIYSKTQDPEALQQLQKRYGLRTKPMRLGAVNSNRVPPPH